MALAGTALAAAALAQAATTRQIDNSGLEAASRAWDFYTRSDASLVTQGFSPVEDGLLTSKRPPRGASDGFDGGLLVDVDGTAFADGDGKGSFDAKANSFEVGPDLTGTTLKVARTETAKGPYLRSLVKLANPSASAFTATITWDSDLGSDNSESVQASSSGDKTFTKADRWVISSETGANGFTDDPTLTFVLFGKRAQTKVSSVVNGPGSGFLTVEYEVKVPAHAARYLLFYTEMNVNPAQAKKSAGKYDQRSLSKGLLAGISEKVRKRILNWDVG